MEAIKIIPGVVIALVIAGLVSTAGLKVLGNFKSTQCTGGVYHDGRCRTCPTINDAVCNGSTGCTYLTHARVCTNSSGGNTTYISADESAEFNATGHTMSGTTEISAQFPTIGIIAAMVVILMMIGGLAAYFAIR